MNTMKRMLYIGLPGGAQAVIYNVANTILHAKVNVFGTDTVAAFSAYGKLDLIFWMLVSAFGISASTFSGQNWGAGKKERARKGMWECFAICLALSILTVIFYLTFGERCYGFFTDDPAVIEIGMRILRTIAPCFVLYIPIEIISGGFRGTGKTVIPTLITLFGTCAIRVAWLMTPYGSSTIERVSLCCGISWTVGSILFFVYYAIDRPFGKKGGRKEITL